MSSASEQLNQGGPLDLGGYTPPVPPVTRLVQIGADGCRLEKRNVVQGTATGVEAIVTWDTAVYDNTGLMASATAIKIATSGLYLVTGQVEWDVSGAGVRQIRLSTLTKEIGRVVALNAGVAANAIQQVTGVEHLLAGDVVELLAFQNTGGALNIINAVIGDSLTWIAAQLLST